MNSFFDVEKELEMTDKVISGKKIDSSYDNIYTRSNEKLDELFKQFDVSNKKVLTVLASSDQLFFSLLNGASSVDCFDINRLTQYFYYLRKWNIIYNNKFYLPVNVTGLFINDLLCKAESNILSENEERAYRYWYKFIRTYPAFMYKKMFFTPLGKRQYDIDMDLLKEKLITNDLNFRCLDLSDKVSNDDYDIIITSNISEYFYDNYELLSNYKSNLVKLLGDGGSIISSHMMFYTIPSREMNLFSDEFDFREFPFYYDEFYSDLASSNFPLGYSYTKKRDVNKK